MKTFEAFLKGKMNIPAYTVWLLNILSEYKGKQELFKRQSPEKLEALKESSIVESAVSSNRIEGVEIDRLRVGTVVFGEGMLTDRNEEEVRGYKQALKWIHEKYEKIAVTPETVMKLHEMTKPNIWDSGKFKEKDGEIIEKHPDGRINIRFIPVSADNTPEYLRKLCSMYTDSVSDKIIPSLVSLAAFNLDFLSIHPFRDGNGRVSRLLILLMMYKLGFDAGKYVSVEKIIERNKERYYETLFISSQKWHEGSHDPWKYIDYLLHIFKELYEEFEDRYKTTVVLKSSEKDGGKGSEKSSEKIVEIISGNPTVTISELSELIGISTRAVEKHLKKLRENGIVKRENGRKSGSWEVVKR